MNFDFEISRVDCISKNVLFLFQHMKKLELSHLKHPPVPPLYSARKILRARSTLMHLVYVNKNILFSVYSSGLFGIVNKKRYDTTWCHINGR